MSVSGDTQALAWLTQYCADRGIDRERLSLGEDFLLMQVIPCRIRCWRVGGPVEVADGETCPECGLVAARTPASKEKT